MKIEEKGIVSDNLFKYSSEYFDKIYS